MKKLNMSILILLFKGLFKVNLRLWRWHYCIYNKKKTKSKKAKIIGISIHLFFSNAMIVSLIDLKVGYMLLLPFIYSSGPQPPGCEPVPVCG